VDYRKLNNIIVKNKFPLPNIDEFLDEILGAKFFTTIDLAFDFYQIRMLPEDEAKTAFKTHHGTSNSGLCLLI
jgi:DNA relaxase NicK